MKGEGLLGDDSYIISGDGIENQISRWADPICDVRGAYGEVNGEPVAVLCIDGEIVSSKTFDTSDEARRAMKYCLKWYIPENIDEIEVTTSPPDIPL
jgi:hypothetical protein